MWQNSTSGNVLVKPFFRYREVDCLMVRVQSIWNAVGMYGGVTDRVTPWGGTVLPHCIGKVQ